MLTGALKEGEKLPSVRQMSKQLAVNPNTIQRAYRELETEGLFYSVQGKGIFVGGGEEAMENYRKEERQKMKALIEELKNHRHTDEEILRMVEEILKEI